MASICNRSIFECLTFFARIDAQAFKDRSERRRISPIPLGGEVPAEDTTTAFREALLQTFIDRRRCVTIA